ncbi:MAG: M20/M25/M40 family metallo-hydrolase [Methylovirgula sp.]|nr:M20/M25/M40 family metallo-hydrolase [Methylovirgula sp.]
MAQLDAALAKIDANLDTALKRLFALVAIPSVSTDPAYAAACQKAAEWLRSELAGLGFEATVRSTPGRPMVVAHAKAGRPGAPHVLFYGHYDVQPPDPLDLWQTPPFEPRLAEAPTGTQIVGRGTSDDKGQLMTFVEACRALRETGPLPCDITILFEGEEESGSRSLPAFLAENKAELHADIALICDTGMLDRTTPAITTMLRGIVTEEIVIKGADRDLHSGVFGGAAVNPIHVLARIIADLHDADGRVTLPGFYDGVAELPAEIAEQWRHAGFDGEQFLNDVGLSVPAGEKGRSVLEMLWSRPTCDVNGIVGGYTGKGFKTVLPAQAGAKISFRLVGTQDPQKISASFRTFVEARLPADCRAEFHAHGGSEAQQLPLESPALACARAALREEWGKEAVLIGCGGSLPIVGAFKRDLGMDSLMIGFGLEDDRIHSPNEKYELSSFHKGARSWVRVLMALGAA